VTTRVALLHGFTQTGASWAPVAGELTRQGFQVVAPDLPGHGTRAGQPADVPGSAAVAVASCGRAAYVGYSMGGRIALQAALDHPQDVERLVLIGATAGLGAESERRARQQADDELARSIEVSGVEAFLDRWLALDLFATLTPEQADRDTRSRDGAGLAGSLRLAGTGAMEPLWDRLPELRMPALLVAGELDSKFRALAEEMARRWGGPVEVAVIAGAGHACHLERPQEFVARVTTFLAGGHDRASATE
jgi:2-succinyl-6-hydroxy-2,4-cyclohexadiene-1-carboxylate synthase